MHDVPAVDLDRLCCKAVKVAPARSRVTVQTLGAERIAAVRAIAASVQRLLFVVVFPGARIAIATSNSLDCPSRQVLFALVPEIAWSHIALFPNLSARISVADLCQVGFYSFLPL
jgi:hypothetical protein